MIYLKSSLHVILKILHKFGFYQAVFEKKCDMRLAQPSANGGCSENGPLTWRIFSLGMVSSTQNTDFSRSNASRSL